MKQIIVIMISAGMLLTTSCKKSSYLNSSFAIRTTKMSYKVGEPVEFIIDGNPPILSFFSGETGKRYEFVNRAQADGVPKLQFTSLVANGSQPNSLALMVSDNFKGIGADEAATAANTKAATWKDITSRVTLSTGAATSSGAIDLSDIASSGKPVWIAFRYQGIAGSIQRKWTITGLTVTNTLADGTSYTLANLNNTVITNYGVSLTTSPGWSAAKVTNTFGWAVSAGSSLIITGASTVAAAAADAEAWVFTGPVDLKRVTPDRGGIPIKNMSTKLASYSYIYKTAGTFTPTFEGAVQTVYDKEVTVQKLNLTITP